VGVSTEYPIAAEDAVVISVHIAGIVMINAAISVPINFTVFILPTPLLF
jgi:hypothetical protein